jgi:hypothetical protein
MHAFFHSHTGCLDSSGKCHAFCYTTSITDADGDTEPFDSCPDANLHPDSFAKLTAHFEPDPEPVYRCSDPCGIADGRR